MKHLMIALLVGLTSATAFAQPITLEPGASIVLNGDVVTCQGPSEDSLPELCSIRQDGSYYRLYVGQTIAESFRAFSYAVEGAKQLKEAGLCR